MKVQKNFRLDEATLSYIRDFRNNKKLANDTAALMQIIEEHKHRNDIPATTILVNELSKGVAEELKDTLTRIRLGTNNADRNSDVILLLLNTLLFYSNFKTLVVKDTPQLSEARQIVKDKIAKYKQRKDNRPTPIRYKENHEEILDEEILL